MQLGKASAYATFATIFIAEHQADGPVHGRRIAEACGIPSEYLLKILQQLTRAKILVSETGRKGGFMLRRSANKTTLLQIVETIEGPVRGELGGKKEIHGSQAAKNHIESMCQNVADNAKVLLRETTIEQLINLH